MSIKPTCPTSEANTVYSFCPYSPNSKQVVDQDVDVDKSSDFLGTVGDVPF